MATFKVQVLGRKKIETPSPSLPQPGFGLTALPQTKYEEVALLWPQVCPCCAKPITNHSRIILSNRHGSASLNALTSDPWQVPYCEDCIRHVTLKQQRPSSSSVIEIGSYVLAAIFVFSFLPSNIPVAITSFIILIGAGIFGNIWILRRYENAVVLPAMSPDCASCGPALRYHGWDEERLKQVFLIQNEHYARQFCEANQAGQINQVK